jgi:hypothetical protein
MPKESNESLASRLRSQGYESARAIPQYVGKSENVDVFNLGESLQKGDVPGHEFHGNQWSPGGGMSSSEMRDHLASQHGISKKESALSPSYAKKGANERLLLQGIHNEEHNVPRGGTTDQGVHSVTGSYGNYHGHYVGGGSYRVKTPEG